MKKLNILLFLLTITITNVNAQFKLESNGEVRLWTNNMGPWDNPMIIFANNDLSKAYCVFRNGTSTFYVKGEGSIYARGLYSYSDEKLKKDIKNIKFVDSLYLLQAKSYRFKTLQDSTLIESDKKITNENIQSKEILQYGFLAQEVKKIYPNLVSEDEKGLLSINYLGFIPLIIEASKQQQEQISTLQKIVYSQEQELIRLNSEINKCCNNKSVLQLKSTSMDATIDSVNPYISEKTILYNNTPNPFSVTTEIKFEIANSFISAKLLIHDMQGIELKSFAINQKGSGSITINASELKAGMYLYTLLVDNVVIDTKRMLLTKE